MKKKLIFIISIIITSCLYSNDLQSILGVWNFDKNDESQLTIVLSTGEYSRTNSFLAFDNDSFGVLRVIYEGGYYSVDLTTQTLDGYDFILSWIGWIKNEKGKAVKGNISGEVKLHFIDSNHIWLELIVGNKTDPQFPTHDFQGDKTILWRGERIFASK